LEELVSGLLRPKLFPFGKLSKAKPAAQVYLFTHSGKGGRGVGGRVKPERRLEGQQFTNRKYKHD
jgi:hypothetical protein